MPTQSQQHNESKAELNSDGPTIDAEVSVSRDSIESLVGKLEIVGLVLTIAGASLKLWNRRNS
jgi:hypothetical protein